MKKCILTVLSILIIAAAVIAGVESAGEKSAGEPQIASADEEDSLIPAVEFEGRKFYLEHTSGDAREWLSEYLLPGEDLKSYTEKIVIRTYDGIHTSSRKVASAIITHFTKNNKGVPYDFLQGARPNEWEISYTLRKPKYAEFSLFRTAPNGKYPVAIQYVRRVNLPTEKELREQTLKTFEKEVEENIGRWIDALRQVRVPRFFRAGR